MPNPTLLTDVGFRLSQVLFAYLTTRNYDFAYDKSHNVRPKRNIRMAMQHEVSMYAIAQKEGNGLDKAVEDCKYRMKRYGVTPNLLVIPPQLSLYMALAPEEKLTCAKPIIKKPCNCHQHHRCP